MRCMSTGSALTWRRFSGRYHDGFNERHSFLVACRQDPLLRQVKMIAEPWDCGPGGYQVGGLPAGLGRVERPLSRHRAGFLERRRRATGRLRGTHDRLRRAVQPARTAQPYSSVNFITAHDGFTLHDLVSYNDKHNEANDENNQDGSNNNLSWNHGVEGPTDDPEINALRLRQMRNFFATLLLAQGTPMIVAGDEFARTQHGNNNAYCQDSEIGWINWDLDEDGKSLLKFVKRLIKLRNSYPILRRGRFLVGHYNEDAGVKDVTWLAPDGNEMTIEQWEDPQRPQHRHAARRPGAGVRGPALRRRRHVADRVQRPARRRGLHLAPRARRHRLDLQVRHLRPGLQEPAHPGVRQHVRR
jgi:isoamylase